MPGQTLDDLGKLVKTKYPGQYDDLPDGEVGKRVQTKFPGAYDDFKPAAIAPAAAAPQQPQKISDSLPHPAVVDQMVTAAARAFAQTAPGSGDPMNAGISATPPQTLWQRITAPLMGGMTGDVRAHDTAISKAFGGAQEPPAVSAGRNSLVDFENLNSSRGPGVVRGAEQFASGMTEPQSLLLMAGSAGLGSLSKQLGAGVITRLVSAGFTADMLHQAYSEIPSLREAWNKSDWPQVRQQLVRMALGTGMAALAGRHALKGEGRPAAAQLPEQQYTITGEPVRSGNEIPVDGKTGAQEQPQGGGATGRQPAAGAQRSGGGTGTAEQPARAAEPQKVAAGAPAKESTIKPEVPSGPANTNAMDAGAARPAHAGGSGEGAAVHGTGASIPGRAAGENTSIVVPGEDREINGRYEVRELSAVQPSHNGLTFSPNEKYALRNERDYSKAENQQRVIENSSEERFNPRYHITDNPDATNGPVVVDEAGNALGGNSRAMHLQRVYGRDGQSAAAYRALLEKKAAQFGIDAEQLKQFKQPVLVRVVPDAELDSLPGGSKWAIRKTNVSGTAALSSSERAAADAGQLSPELVEHVAQAIEDAGPDATLNDALTGKSGTAIVNRMIADGFFSEQERPSLMDGKTGALTQVAKDRISKAMLGQFFRDSDQIARTPASVRNKLERIAAPLAKVQGNPEWDLTPAIREAIDLVEYANAHGIKNLGDVLAQESMFGEAKPWNTDAVKLAEWLRDAKPNELVSATRKYVNDREPNMFGEPTPAESFAANFGGEKRQGPVEQQGPGARDTGSPTASGPGATPPAAPAEGFDVAPGDGPPARPAETETGVYFGSGLGAFEPFFRESKAEGDALLAKRRAALEAIDKARETPEQKKAGEGIRAYFLAERDLWVTRANQALDIVNRKVVPKFQDREAIAIMREFRHRPEELQQFIDGSHPFLQEVNGSVPQGMKNLDKLQKVMQEARRMLVNPTAEEAKADRLYTNISAKSLEEGRKGGWLESRWQPDEYVPHLLHPKGEGEIAKLPSTIGQRQGKIGKYFGFAERRSDPYPTMVHAVADGLIPKTLDASRAFAIHADKFAQARATHLLEGELTESGLGKWGAGTKNIPEGWVQLAAHTNEFELQRAYQDPETGLLEISKQGLYVPEFIDKAFSGITDPNYMPRFRGFSKLRSAQRQLKESILGLSGFHLLTENVMAKADMGVSALVRALKTPRESADFLMNERDLVRAGGTTSIQGQTVEAYRSLKPGTIPTRGEVIRAWAFGKHIGAVGDAITRLTFDNVQRKFKVVSFALHRDAWMSDNPGATPEQILEAKRGIASYVNGVYGGLHWENMGISKAVVETMRAVLLAPDWSGSNMALGKYALDAPVSGAELRPRLLGGEPLKGALSKEAVQARLSRAFWSKQLAQGLAENQALSLLFSGQLSSRPFQVYMGRDKNGEDVYQNIVFRGSAGDAVNLAGKVEDRSLAGVGVFAAGKAAPFAKLGLHFLTNQDDLGKEIAPKGLSFVANTARAGGTWITDVSPVPLTFRSGYRTMFSDDSDRYVWSERAMTLFGPPAQHVPPAGMSFSKKNGLREKRTHPPRSIWEQIKTGRQ